MFQRRNILILPFTKRHTYKTISQLSTATHFISPAYLSREAHVVGREVHGAGDIAFVVRSPQGGGAFSVQALAGGQTKQPSIPLALGQRVQGPTRGGRGSRGGGGGVKGRVP